MYSKAQTHQKASEEQKRCRKEKQQQKKRQQKAAEEHDRQHKKTSDKIKRAEVQKSNIQAADTHIRSTTEERHEQ